MRIELVSRAAIILACVGAGCGTVQAPQELVAARTSYEAAQNGAAAKYNPADLHTAGEALKVAEQSFIEEGDAPETRDLAYLADRRAQIAEVRARTKIATEKFEQTLSAQAKATVSELGAAKQQLALQQQAIAQQNSQLVAAREAQAAAEQRAARAAADLAKFASVKQETRGMVITLSGAVLFTSGKSDLLPSAQLKLKEVAEALIKQDPDSAIVVEGHTDSQGGERYNKELSERRAQSVRDYLVSQGIASDRITSKGYGYSRSMADNKSHEGRANNRRVEIVVAPSARPVEVQQ